MTAREDRRPHRRNPPLAFSPIRPYIARMQRRLALSTTTTTPGLPGCVGLRVTACRPAARRPENG